MMIGAVSISEGRAYHYVRVNETTKQPRRHVVIDVAATMRPVKGGAARVWLGACAVLWSQRKGRDAIVSRATFATPGELWGAIDAHTNARERTIVWGHNIGYDVVLSSAVSELTSRGWVLQAHSLMPRGTWLTWRRNGATLTIVDSASIWGTTAGELGKMFGRRAPHGRKTDLSNVDKVEISAYQADTLHIAVTEYLAWLERDDLGNWQPTGAGQSYAHYRHRHLTGKLLVHADAEALAMERRAMWTGRTEAYWHGAITREVVHEWDMTAAYARCALDTRVPTQLIGPFGARHPWQSTMDNPDVAMLAHVTVETVIPTVPTEHNGRIVWPVGRFDTVLWDQEIRAALEDGANVTVHKGYLYRATPALRTWAQWILAQLGATDQDVPAWRKKIIKHWSRTLIGRFGMTYASWERVADDPSGSIDYRDLYDADTDTYGAMMTIGGGLWMQGGRVEWDQSMPAITGYIMAECRVRLWRLLRSLPRECPLYVDTDSLICHDSQSAHVATAASTMPELGLVLKKSWDGIEIRGPRQIITGGQLRASGVPTRATRAPDGSYHGAVWQTPIIAVTDRERGTIRATDRKWRVDGKDTRRVTRGLGWTEPIVLGL